MRTRLFAVIFLVFAQFGATHAGSLRDASDLVSHKGPVDDDGCHLDSEGRRHCH